MHPETNAHIYTNAWVPLSGQHRSEAIWAIASMYGSTEGLDGILDALASGRVRPMLLCGILQNVSEGAASSRGGVPGDTGNARYSYNILYIARNRLFQDGNRYRQPATGCNNRHY